MEKDLSIIFEGKLQNVKDDLNQLKKLDFDVSKIEQTINQIEAEVNQKVKENYEIFDKVDSKTFLHDTIGMIYSNATSRLEKIGNLIKEEYEMYYIINAKYLSLNKMVATANKNNTAMIAQKGIELLDSIRESSTIDYNMERNLVEKVYELIYKIIKIELIYEQNSYLVAKIIDDETDWSYLAKLVKNDIDNLPKESRKQIDDIVAELAIDGLDDDDYLNEKLLTEIIIAKDNSLIEKINSNFFEKFETYKKKEKEFALATENTTKLSSNYDSVKKNVKKSRFGKIRKVSSMSVNLVLLTAGIATSIFVLKKPTSVKEYLTTTQTYDSLTGEEPKEETYERSLEDNVTLVEYSPWDAPGYFRDEYTRNEYEYNLSELKKGFSNPKDYLNSDLKEQITFKKTEKSQKEKPDDYGYQENRYIVTKVEQNKDVFNEVPWIEIWALCSVLAALGLTVIDYLIYTKLISKEKYVDLKFFSKVEKEELKKISNQLTDMSNQLLNLKMQLATEKTNTIMEYESLPRTIQEIPKVKEKIIELRGKNNS